MSAERAAPKPGRPTTYRGLYDMAEWWDWTDEAIETFATMDSYRPFIRSGSLVFDIGANRGQKTYIFRKLGARVIAVEPLFTFGDEFLPEFHWKFGDDPQVMWVPRAVSSDHIVTINVNRFMPEYSSIDKRWMYESSHAPKFGQTYYVPTSLITRQVQTVTLDGLIAFFGQPYFIKIDVEGAEDDVVATLSTPVMGLNMEFHRDWIPIRALEHMDGLGEYRWNYCLNNAGQFIMPDWVCRGKLLDYLKTHLTEEGDGSWGDIYGRLT